ncbi:hypothetical protein MYX04_05730 [Nitrospiraceae bacterium AH_259_D15_M11_P09]|nr:hypothetical protein [Nitrospiraceae bacterium AH_259_D15_M11_P09]
MPTRLEDQDARLDAQDDALNLADLLGAKAPFAAHPIALLLGASLKEIQNERKRAVLDLLT